jgi:hypothetical protein
MQSACNVPAPTCALRMHACNTFSLCYPQRPYCTPSRVHVCSLLHPLTMRLSCVEQVHVLRGIPSLPQRDPAGLSAAATHPVVCPSPRGLEEPGRSAHHDSCPGRRRRVCEDLLRVDAAGRAAGGEEVCAAHESRRAVELVLQLQRA